MLVKYNSASLQSIEFSATYSGSNISCLRNQSFPSQQQIFIGYNIIAKIKQFMHVLVQRNILFALIIWQRNGNESKNVNNTFQE